jgi:hypothetical protein
MLQLAGIHVRLLAGPHTQNGQGRPKGGLGLFHDVRSMQRQTSLQTVTMTRS